MIAVILNYNSSNHSRILHKGQKEENKWMQEDNKQKSEDNLRKSIFLISKAAGSQWGGLEGGQGGGHARWEIWRKVQQ